MCVCLVKCKLRHYASLCVLMRIISFSSLFSDEFVCLAEFGLLCAVILYIIQLYVYIILSKP